MADQPLRRDPLILFAMKEEMAPLPAVAKRHGWTWQRAKGSFLLLRGDKRYDVILTGPGRPNVAEALAGRTPSAVINPGFAGSISMRFGLGDLAVVASVRCGSRVEPVNSEFSSFSQFPKARIVTAPEPLGIKDKRTMFDDDAGDLVDMESYHVFQFCRESKIPYYGLRAVSDGLEDELPGVVKESFDGRQFRLGRIVRAAVFSSKTRRELLRLRASSQLAANKLAIALIAAI